MPLDLPSSSLLSICLVRGHATLLPPAESGARLSTLLRMPSPAPLLSSPSNTDVLFAWSAGHRIRVFPR